MIHPSWFQGHRDPQFTSNVFFTVSDSSGVHEFESGNLITNIGETMARNLLGFNNISSYAPLQYISLGNATVAVTLTKLTTESTTNGFNRTQDATPDAWLNGTDSAFNVTVTFTVSGLGVGEYISVQSAGLHWNETDESDNNMFACAYLTDGTYHQFTNGSTCTVTWVITVDAN